MKAHQELRPASVVGLLHGFREPSLGAPLLACNEILRGCRAYVACYKASAILPRPGAETQEFNNRLTSHAAVLLGWPDVRSCVSVTDRETYIILRSQSRTTSPAWFPVARGRG